MEEVTNSRRHPNVESLKETISNSWGTILEASKVEEVTGKIRDRLVTQRSAALNFRYPT